MRKIAVIGATGMLGIPVTAALAEAGFKVTALVRDPEHARRLLPAKVRLVQADVRDEESLRRGLAGQDGLYLSLSVAPTERRQDLHTEAQGLELILAAARACEIKRIGYLSAMIEGDEDDGWWVRAVWRAAVKRIKASGIPYTIFYPSNLMETIAERHMVGGVLVMTGYSHYCNYWIAGCDFGRQVARAFRLPKAANREYVIQGPEPLTYDEAAVRYGRTVSDKLLVVRLPLTLIRVLGIVSRPMRFNARIMGAVLGYYEMFKAEDAWDELGRPTTTIEEFAKARANGRAAPSAGEPAAIAPPDPVAALPAPAVAVAVKPRAQKVRKRRA